MKMTQSYQVSPNIKKNCFSPLALKPPTKLDKNLKYTNDKDMNDIQKIRDNIRKNQICHKDFNPIYEMEDG